ncbi:Uncharacterised protein [Taylorella equigenitalis ATCC 35865]|nr:Uncharacterised protein [Taylorella equigenitalis ATCC 35865]
MGNINIMTKKLLNRTFVNVISSASEPPMMRDRSIASPEVYRLLNVAVHVELWAIILEKEDLSASAISINTCRTSRAVGKTDIIRIIKTNPQIMGVGNELLFNGMIN